MIFRGQIQNTAVSGSHAIPLSKRVRKLNFICANSYPLAVLEILFAVTRVLQFKWLLEQVYKLEIIPAIKNYFFHIVKSDKKRLYALASTLG